MRYNQESARRLAPCSAHGAFRAIIRLAASAALEAPNLTASDRQMLHDLRRAEQGRYGFRAVDRVLDLLATVPSDASAFLFPEELHSAIQARRVRNEIRDVRAAYLAETTAVANADTSQAHVVTDHMDDLDTLSDAIAKTDAEAVAARHLADALRGHRLAVVLQRGGK